MIVPHQQNIQQSCFNWKCPWQKNITQNGRFTTEPKYKQNMKSKSTLSTFIDSSKFGWYHKYIQYFFFLHKTIANYKNYLSN